MSVSGVASRRNRGKGRAMTSIYLNKFKIINPKNKLDQKTLLDWTVAAHQAAESNSVVSSVNKKILSSELIENLFKRFAVKESQIGFRFTECDDVYSTAFSQNKIYRIGLQQTDGANIQTRALYFSEVAFAVLKKMYGSDDTTDIADTTATRPDHLIHVTCTGYISPSAAQKIVTETFWKKETDITHAYHMGCYAALPAIRLAKSLVHSEYEQNPQFTADIVHTEMCSLHMNPSDQTPEQMVVQTLFADGHVKYSARAQKAEAGKNLKIIALLEKVIPETEGDMSWIPTAWGMQMNLSREVPEKIKSQLKSFAAELFNKSGLNLPDALKSVFAIHPGGPKIIDAVQASLELKDHQIQESRNILFQRGNMSSATLPHVWDEILNANYPIGTKVISFAFGPGLTLFGAAFEIC